MVKIVEVDDDTARSLEFAARIAGTSVREVIARLVAEASAPLGDHAKESPDTREARIAIYADYAGQRTRATYDETTTRVDVTSGPLSGRSFKTPTGAARAVIGHYKPDINPNRNGWTFWTVDDGSGQLLHAIRRS